jgi:hypothetical protein
MLLLAYDISVGQPSAATQQAKDHYPYTILHNITSFFHNFPSTTNNLQYQKPDTATVKERETKDPFLKRILIVDDEPDVDLTFKVGLEEYIIRIMKEEDLKMHTYIDPKVALSKFKPHFYDLLLTDISCLV